MVGTSLTLSQIMQKIYVSRILVKENFTRDMGGLLMNDIKNTFKGYRKDFDNNSNEKEPSINIF